jgi:hypothetical protein
MTAPPARSWIVPALVVGGLAAAIALHVVEPASPITWSYAHLGRRPELRPVALLLVVALPVAAMRLRRTSAWDAPLRGPSPAAVVGVALALGVGVWALGHVGSPAVPLPAGRALSRARDFFEDKRFFVSSVNDDIMRIARWHLTLWTFHGLAVHTVGAPLGGDVPQVVAAMIYRANQVLGVLALGALALAARALARTRGEAAAVWLLAVTSLGVLETATGYVDVYPTALAFTSLYLWTAVRAVRGELHPAWALGIAALGPFSYEGLLLLGPSAALVTIVAASGPGGRRRVALALAVAVVCAGAATLPVYGALFAWRRLATAMAADNAVALGWSPTSNLVPWQWFATALHAREVLHTLLLVDGTGVLLVVVLAPALARRVWREPALWVVGAVVAPYLAYVACMDPIYGAFADWDLFGYGAAATSLLGAALLVRWGRDDAPGFALVLGLAVAANAVHLLARYHALDVDLPRHIAESPRHVPG